MTRPHMRTRLTLPFVVFAVALATIAALVMVLALPAGDAPGTAASGAATATPAPRAIVCVGDSITYGAGVDDPATQAWPALLQGQLGSGITVHNLGLSGRTLMSTGAMPYTDEPQYDQSFEIQNASYLVMLGTNDAAMAGFDPDAFRNETRQLLQAYADRAGADHVVVMLPPKIFGTTGANGTWADRVDRNIQAELPILQEVADELGIATIDLYHFTESHPEWFPDGVHPNEEGNRQLASHIQEHLPAAFLA